MIKRISGVIIFIFLFKSCINNEDRILPVITSLTESVYASATIQPDSLYSAYASVNGIVEKLFVAEGDLVKRNSRIMKIINNNPRLVSENAKLSYDLALENFSGRTAVLTSIEKEMEAMDLTLKNDSINFYRQQHLWDRKIGSKAAYEARKLAFELSRNKLRVLHDTYERTKNELAVQLKQARNNFLNTINTTDDFTVKSEIKGKVYFLYKEQGEIVNATSPVAVIGKANVFIIQLLVDEVDIVKIISGQQVFLSLDSYEDQIFIAEVSKIYPKKDERNQTFLVEAIFIEKPETLYAGLSGEANIVISQKARVLTIPKEYLVDGNKVRTESGLVSVQIGLQSLDTVEILSGITSGTWIYKPGS